SIVSVRSRWYRGYLLWLALAPMTLLYFGKPVGVVIVYSILGALFMPFLAGTLLYLGRKGGPMAAAANGWPARVGLVLGLALFGYLALRRIAGL
ncbi:MAG: divalent metal cation transporter, partial [Deltaproteobacteria bacterium]